ncbi:hypothetical protein GCM10020358_60330 [Amorphoplanes nipponensis]
MWSAPAAPWTVAGFWSSRPTEVLRRLDVALSGYAGEAAADTAAYSANEVALLVTFFEQGSARRTRHAARLRELTHER